MIYAISLPQLTISGLSIFFSKIFLSYKSIIILLILTGTVLAEALGDQGIITMALKATRSI